MPPFSVLKKPFPFQIPQADSSHDNRYGDGDDKAIVRSLKPVDNVHTIETGDERREHQHDIDRREVTHCGIHVVVDDALIGVHRRLQNVGVDVGSLACLRHLDAHIFDKVGIQFVDLQLEFQLLQQVLIATDGSDEEGQRVLDCRGCA